MKISKNLPQFTNQPTLLLVSGREEARVYFARNGLIDETMRLRTRHPRYTDTEGNYRAKSRGAGMMSSGAVYERSRMEEEVTVDFYRKLKGEIQAQEKKSKHSDYYLFAPQHRLAQLRKTLAPSSQKRIKRTFTGNYTKAHPFELLKMIGARRERRLNKRRVVPTKARKLLK